MIYEIMQRESFFGTLVVLLLWCLWLILGEHRWSGAKPSLAQSPLLGREEEQGECVGLLGVWKGLGLGEVNSDWWPAQGIEFVCVCFS